MISDKNNLRIFKDSPQFDEEYFNKLEQKYKDHKEREKRILEEIRKDDIFNHNTYADILYDIISNNKDSIAIGLLGPWGYGKSSIFNLLNYKLKSEEEKINTVIFNAWKYSSDSFRRQFLLESVNQLFCENDEQQKYDKSKELKTIKYKMHYDLEKDFLTDFSFPNIIRGISLFLVLALLLAIYYYPPEDTGVNISIIIGFIVLFISQIIPKMLFSSYSYDPRIMHPEQFNEEFNNIINKVDRDILFIIDDIDRCKPETIMTILDSIKNYFIHVKNTNKNVYFILALDEKAVISILKKYRSEKYIKEEILKFFDVTVRTNHIRFEDLSKYGESLVLNKEYGIISDKVIDIIMYAGFDTPREIKHFVNSLKVILETAKKRDLRMYFDGDSSKLEEYLAKVLVINIEYPERFEELKNNISLQKKWEEESISKNFNKLLEQRKIALKNENNSKDKGKLDELVISI